MDSSEPDPQTRRGRVSRAQKRPPVENDLPSKRRLVPGSIGEIVSLTPRPRTWEAVNSLTATPIVAPNSPPPIRTSYKQLVAKVLKNNPEGLSSPDISSKILASLCSVIDQKKAKGAIVSALSNGARGPEPMFEKRGQSKSYIWTLKEYDFRNFSHPNNEAMENCTATREHDREGTVSTLLERSSVRPPSSTANDPINNSGDQVLEHSLETHRDSTTRLLDEVSSEAAEIINSVVTDQLPHVHATEDFATASVVETGQHAGLQGLQPITLPVIDPTEQPSISEPRLSAHDIRHATSHITLLCRPLVRDPPLAHEEHAAARSGSPITAPRGIQSDSTLQNLASKEPLHPSLLALRNTFLEGFQHRQQQLRKEFRNRFLIQNDDDAHLNSEAFWKDSRLDDSPIQHTSTIKDVHLELDKLERARFVKKHVEEAILSLSLERTTILATIDELKQSVDDLGLSIKSLETYRVQAVASEKGSCKRITTFANQDSNDPDID